MSLAKILTTINLITFAMGAPTHAPYELCDNHGIYATTMLVANTEVYDMGTSTIEDDEGLIELVDSNGEGWNYEQYPEDYYPGDYVSALMDDNGTPNYIYDDIIIELRATGFYR